MIGRSGLEKDLTQRFVTAMMKLNKPAHRDKLAYLYGPDGYVIADSAAYDGVRDMARHFGLIE